AAGATLRHEEARRPRRRGAGRRARLGRPAHRRLRLLHRDALPQGAEGDQLVLHARLGDPLRLHRPGHHRGLPGDVLHALDDPGLPLDLPHQQRSLPRRLRARHAQVGIQRDGDPGLPPHGEDLLLRRLQVPARAQLGDRRRPPDPDDDDGLHRLPAAIRPALLLGLGGRHQHQRHRPGHRPLPERRPARRPGAGGDHALALLRDPHAADPGRDHRPDRRPPLPRGQARHHRAAVAESREAEGRGAHFPVGRRFERDWRMKPADKQAYLEEYELLKKKGKPFFPYAVLKDSTMALLVVAVVIAMSIVLGAEQGPKADPTTTTYVPRPEWYFFFLFELLRVIKPAVLTPVATIGIPTVCIVLLILLPFYDRGPERRPERRPIATTAGILVIFAMAFLTYLGAAAGSPTEIDISTPKGMSVADTKAFNAGRLVAAQSGCTAWDKFAENGNDGPGPHLTTLGGRLPREAIARTLVNPTAPMPSYKDMPAQKFNNLVVFLSQLK